MPARCVPWPNGSPRHRGLGRDQVHVRDDARIERCVQRNAGIENRDADALAGIPRRREQTEQTLGALPDGLGRGHLVRDRHARMHRQVAGDVEQRRIALQLRRARRR